MRSIGVNPSAPTWYRLYDDAEWRTNHENKELESGSGVCSILSVASFKVRTCPFIKLTPPSALPFEALSPSAASSGTTSPFQELLRSSSTHTKAASPSDRKITLSYPSQSKSLQIVMIMFSYPHGNWFYLQKIFFFTIPSANSVLKLPMFPLSTLSTL